MNFNYTVFTGVKNIATTGRLVNNMITKMHLMYLARSAKEEVFKVKWNRLLYKIMSLGKKDKVMSALSKELFKMPTEVKQYVSRLYINACQRQHSIAFMEWRELYHASD